MAAVANRFRLINEIVDPLAVTMAAIPAVVIVGVLNRMYPLDSQIGRRIMVTLAVFFIVFVQVAKGLRQNDATQLELMRSYAATPRQVLAKVRLPNTMPYLFTGIRTAVRSRSSSRWSPSTSAARRTASAARSPARSTARTKRSASPTSWADRSSDCCSSSAHISWSTSSCRGNVAASPGEHTTTTGTTTRGEHAKQTSNQGDHCLEHRGPAGGCLRRRQRVRRYRRTAESHRRVDASGNDARRVDAGRHHAAAETPSAGEGLKVDVATCTAPTGADVKLQLQWFTQSQFAGYFAAVDQGFYEDAGLNVEIVEGGVEIAPQKTLASGAVDFAISWVPKALAEREAGAKVTDIAQIFQRSGTLQVSFKDAGITSAADFAGKKIGNWGFGNEYEIFAALSKEGLDPASDVTLIQQNFDMAGLLAGDIDAAEAMTYNEYAQVLEAVNPDTGELYTADDLNVVSYEDEGVGMLQDAIWADEARLADPAYCGEAIAFVKASIQGWAYCRDNVEACRDIVVAKGSTLGATHQLWQMNEVNKLIWPAEGGIGVIDTAAYERTIGIASGTKNLDGATVLTKAPTRRRGPTTSSTRPSPS